MRKTDYLEHIDLVKELFQFKNNCNHLREQAFAKICEKLNPCIQTIVSKLAKDFSERSLAEHYVKYRLFQIINNPTFKIKNGHHKQHMFYITSTMKFRTNKFSFEEYYSNNGPLDGFNLIQYRVKNTKKIFIKKYGYEPKLIAGTDDIAKFCKLGCFKNEDEVLVVVSNFRGAIDRFDKPLATDKNGSDLKLMDILHAETNIPDEDFFTKKLKDDVFKEVEALLSPEQFNLIKLYYLDDNDMTKEQIAKKLKYNAAGVKNTINTSKQILKKSNVLKAIFANL